MSSPLAIWLLSALAAAGAPARVTITHSRGEGALACPDEAALKGNVVARLGYDPFVPEAPLRAVTRVERGEHHGFTATLSLIRDGEAPRTRTLTSPASDCRDISDSLALALTLAIDPQFLTREPTPVVIAAPPPPAGPPPAPPAPAAPKEPIELAVYGGALGSAGLSPEATIGGTVGLGFQYRLFALYGEGRIDAPGSLTVSGGVIQTSLLLGTVLPCLQWNRFGVCVALSVGALQVDGRLAFGRRESTPVVTAGIRLQYEWMLFRHVGMLIQGGVGGVPTRVTVFADEAAVWSTSPVTASLGLGIVGLF